jgi:hypothetical protein
VDGAGQDVAPLVEDRLRAVAVVGVDVDDGDRPAEVRAQTRGGRGGVVEVARSAVRRARDVVAGRAAAGVRRRGLAGGDEVGRRECRVDRGARRLVRARPDERHRVVGEVAGPRPRCLRDGGREVRRQAGVREDVGDDAVLARIGRQPGRVPCLPGAAQVVEERRIMDGEDVVVGVRLGGDERRVAGAQRIPDRLRAPRHLGAGRAHADPHLSAGFVQAMPVAPDDRQREPHRRRAYTGGSRGRAGR